MFHEYDRKKIRMWVEDEGSVRLRTGGNDKDPGVALTVNEAFSVSRDLLELAIESCYGAKAWERDWMRIPMQVLVIEATQDPDFEHEEKYGGAFVICYIKEQTRRHALFIAKGDLAECGWESVNLESQRSVVRSDIKDDADGSGYYEQALVDGEVYVYNTFSLDGD